MNKCNVTKILHLSFLSMFFFYNSKLVKLMHNIHCQPPTPNCDPPKNKDSHFTFIQYVCHSHVEI